MYSFFPPRFLFLDMEENEEQGVARRNGVLKWFSVLQSLNSEGANAAIGAKRVSSPTSRVCDSQKQKEERKK